MDKPIGVFDSGVGGLTVVQELRKIMPNESIIYFGDTARAPYGGKDTETLINHGREIINFLLSKDVKAVVMACGTSSSTSYERLCEEFPGLPIIDTIRPAVKATCGAQCAHPTSNTCHAQRHEGVFSCVFTATAATVKSGLFTRLVEEACPEIKIHARACPLFAPMVEAGLTGNHPLLAFAAETYLSDLRGKVDALILGCTHYPLAVDALKYVLGDDVVFINPATATAEATKNAVQSSAETDPPVITYYTSGEPERFSEIARYILKEECIAVKA